MSDRIDYDDNGNLDDVVIKDVSMFRLEYMAHNKIWIKLYKNEGDDIVIWLDSRKKINGIVEKE